MRLLVTSLLLLALVVPASAEVTSETGTGQTEGRDKVMSIKKSIETKVSDTKSRGSESNRSASSKSSGTLGGNTSLDLTIPARALIPDDVEYLLAADFGLAAQDRGGWIYTTDQQALEQAAKSGLRVSEITDEAQVRDYLHRVAMFGARAGQAQIILNNWIGRIGSLKKSKTGDYEVSGLGADDLITLAAGAWIQAEEITDRRIRRDLDAILSDKTPCRLAGEASTISCGSIVLKLTAPPALQYRQTDWFGAAFGGINGSYKVSSAWSWQRALEDGQSSSSFARVTADELEARGDAFDATMTRKQAAERSRTNKTSVGTGKPGQQ